MMHLGNRFVSALSFFAFVCGSLQAQTVYLNDANINVSLGASMAAEPFANRSTAASLASIIDAPAAASPENHLQNTHVWVSGGPLELDFDLGQDYDLQTLHLWNYFAEGFDIDNIDFRFFDANRVLVGNLLGVAPALGGAGGNPIFAENLPLSFPGRIRFVNAVLTGSNGEVDFNNLGFTATDSCSTVASWSNFVAGWPGTNGVPSLDVDARPVLGTSINFRIGNASGVPALSAFILGFQQMNTPTMFGGTVIVEIREIASLGTVSALGTSFPWSIGLDSSQCGMEIFCQIVHLDLGASHGVTFSQGLRLTLGSR